MNTLTSNYILFTQTEHPSEAFSLYLLNDESTSTYRHKLRVLISLAFKILLEIKEAKHDTCTKEPNTRAESTQITRLF